jgi:hypothetical protein
LKGIGIRMKRVHAVLFCAVVFTICALSASTAFAGPPGSQNWWLEHKCVALRNIVDIEWSSLLESLHEKAHNTAEIAARVVRAGQVFKDECEGTEAYAVSVDHYDLMAKGQF